MAEELFVSISTPEKLFFAGAVSSLVICSEQGEMEVQSGHQPMIVAMQEAPIRIGTGPGMKEAAIVGGYAQIKHDRVTILADTAEWPADIEYSRAMEAKKRAEERLQSHLSEAEFFQSQAALRRALLRLSLSGGKR